MCSLSAFPLPPPEGYVTVYEKNAELIAKIKSEADDENIGCYPVVNMSAEHLWPSMSGETARSAFLEHDDTPRTRLLKAWYEQGATGILEELASYKDSGLLPRLSGAVLALVRIASSLHSSVCPHLAMSSEDLISEFSLNNAWSTGIVRCFAWHPHTLKFALALRDDTIKIHTAKRDLVPLLKHKMQKAIVAMAWKPMCSSVLAVACQTAILIWTVDPTSLATRPSSSGVQVLRHNGHAPITSLAWCPQGGVLVSASPTDSAIIVWDTSSETSVVLRRVGGGGITLLRWSPDSTKLLAACPTAMFRVWETKTWTCENWSSLTSRCQAACWSPSGDILLFVTADEPIIYSVNFSGSAPVAVACADLTQVEVDMDDQHLVVGGRVQNLVWDPTGERLAVQFKDGSPELIALYQTRLQPLLELIPCGFIRGRTGEVPLILSFQPGYDQGALLTTVWSSGRLSYTSLYFVPRCAVGNQQIYQHTNGNQPIFSEH